MSDPQTAAAAAAPDAAALRALLARSDRAGVLRAATHLGTAAVLGGAIAWLHARDGWGALLALLMIAQGYVVAFLFTALHECAHKTAFRTLALNYAVGYLAGLAIAMPYEYYRLYHWDHHRYTQDPQRDPELVMSTMPRSDAALALMFTGQVQLAQRIAALLRRAWTGLAAAPWIPADRQAAVVRESRAYVAAYGLLLALSVGLQSAVLLWAWVLPLFIGQCFLRPYLLSEHTGCGRDRSAYDNTRTTHTNALVRWFAWNMPYHVEHHAYPSVPFHALPRLHALVGARATHQGRGYPSVTRTVWRWFARQRGAAPLKPEP